MGHAQATDHDPVLRVPVETGTGQGRSTIEHAFVRARADLGIRTGFPPEVLQEAEQAAWDRNPLASPAHADRTDLLLVTIDPPGSRDLDQAVGCAREGDGFKLWYAIADVGFWVDRGSATEREAWLRGVTFYAPDSREPLYPPVLSQDAGSLLPDRTRPALLWEFELDAWAEVRHWTVARACVRSRAQLTYEQFLGFAAPHTEMLRMLAEIGEQRRAREQERGGVSLPIRDQHVQQRSASRLGYQLAYEEPNAAEGWNAQVSLLTGHTAARRMLEAGVGLLRVAAAPELGAISSLRRAAVTLGFAWPEGMTYPEFIRGLDPRHPRADVLVWQARRVSGAAAYVASEGTPPKNAEHGALAFVYAHCTAPLRRLADRYVLDLLADFTSGKALVRSHVDSLLALPEAMHTAQRKAARLERRVVDIAEAWTLRERVGAVFSATAVGTRGDSVELQIEEPPIRATVGASAPVQLGAEVGVKLVGVDVPEGRVHFELTPAA